MNKKIIAIGVMLILIPTIGVFVSAQEQNRETQEELRGIELGRFEGRSLIAMSFNPSQTTDIETTDRELFFYILDSRNAISRITSDLLYNKYVYVVYENDTANATMLQPNEQGIFNISMPNPGTYTIVVGLQPAIPIPLISNIITPSDADMVIVIRRRAFPTTLFISICIVIAVIAGGWYIWKEIKKRRLEEQ